MRLLSTDLVALLDGQRLVLARNTTGNGEINLAIVESVSRDGEPTRALGRDRPGRTLDGAGDRRTGYAHPDLHETHEIRFIEESINRIDTHRRTGGYSRVVLAAAPKALGILRNRFSHHPSPFSFIEVPKNYTKTPIGEVSRLLADYE